MDATGLRLDEAILIGLISGSIFYGAFVVFFFTCLYVLIKRRKTPQPNWVLLGITMCMFVLATIIEALSWSRVLDAFIYYSDTITPIGYFSNPSNWKNLTLTALVCIYLLCADGALIYRCWIVWSRSLLMVLFPLFLFAADIAVVIATVTALGKTGAGSTIFAETVFSWITAVCALTLVQNIVVTGLIVYRILAVHRVSQKHASGATSLIPVVAVILESGAIYVTGLFIFMVCYVTKSNAQYIMLDCMNGIIGLAFTLINIRVGFGLAGSQSSEPSDPKSSGSSYSRDRPSHSFQISQDRSSHALQPIAVSVERDVEMDPMDNDANSDLDMSKKVRGSQYGAFAV